MHSASRRLGTWALAILLASLATFEHRLHDCVGEHSARLDHAQVRLTCCSQQGCATRTVRAATSGWKSDSGKAVEVRSRGGRLQASHDEDACAVCRFLLSRSTPSYSTALGGLASACGDLRLLAPLVPTLATTRRIPIRGPPA